ncbi:MAG: hypothetical protein ACRDT0_04475 [Pseudonocardiaceae bacterium]
MRRVGTALVWTVLIAVLAGCAERPEGIGSGGAPEPDTPPVSSDLGAPTGLPPVPDGPTPPPGGRELPAVQVDATGLPEGYPRLVWTEQGGTVVGAYGQGGGCTDVRAELADQTPQILRVTLVEVTTSSGPCTMDLRFPPLRVPLDAPLGERVVILQRQTVGPPPGR